MAKSLSKNKKMNDSSTNEHEIYGSPLNTRKKQKCLAAVALSVNAFVFAFSFWLLAFGFELLAFGSAKAVGF